MLVVIEYMMGRDDGLKRLELALTWGFESQVEMNEMRLSVLVSGSGLLYPWAFNFSRLKAMPVTVQGRSATNPRPPLQTHTPQVQSLLIPFETTHGFV